MPKLHNWFISEEDLGFWDDCIFICDGKTDELIGMESKNFKWHLKFKL